MVCIVCGQESTKEEVKKKTCTGIKRIRKCDEGHKFSTYQPIEGEEKPALILTSSESIKRMRRELIIKAFQDCQIVGEYQPETLALVEHIRKLKKVK